MYKLLCSTLLFGAIIFSVPCVHAQNYEIDPTFTVGTGLNDVAEHLIIQPDGKILVAGDFTDYNGTTRNKIVRILSDGTVDNTFDAGTTFSSASITDMALQSSGKIIVSGSFSPSVMRLNTDGTVDGTFVFDDTPFTTLINAIDVDVNDRIVIGEGGYASGGTKIARLNTDGSADGSFSPGEFIGNGGGIGPTIIHDITIQNDGKILVCGDFGSYDGNSVRNFLRINASGSIDTGFTPNYTMDVSTYDIQVIRQQSDGKVLIGTVGGYGGSTERFKTDGSADNGFSSSNTYGSAGTVYDIIPSGTDPILVAASGGFGICEKAFVDGTTSRNAVGNGFETSSGTMSIDDIEVDANGRLLAVGTFEIYGGTAVGHHIIRLSQCSTVDITSQPTNPFACENTDTGFGVDATGTGLTYQWQVNTNNGTGLYTDLSDNATYSGTTTDSLAITNVTLGTYDDHRFRCIVSDGSCFVTSSSPNIYVYENQDITTDPTSDEVCEGDDITFTTTLTGPYGNYQWQENTGGGFTDITGETNLSLTITNATQAMTGNEYRLIASRCLADTSATASIIDVIEPPVVTVEDYEFCGGLPDPMTLDVQVTGPNTPYDYQWKGYEGSSTYTNLTNTTITAENYYPGGDYSGTTTSSMSVASPVDNFGGSPALYKVDVTDGVCTVESDFISVDYYDIPTITSDPIDVTICEEENGAQFQVTLGNTNNISTYQWQVDSTGTGTNYEDLVDMAGVYNGSNTLTLNVLDLNTNANGFLYRCVIGTCSPALISTEAALYVDESVSLDANHANITVCEGMEAFFDVDAPQGTNYTFQWQERESGGAWTNLTNGGNYAGVDTDSLIILNSSLNMNTNFYKCIISNGECELTTNQKLLYVDPLPTISQQPQDIEICEGDDDSFYISTSVSATRQWQVDETGNGTFVDIANTSVYSGANSNFLNLISPDATYDGYQFRCVISECLPEIYSDTVTLTVNTIPSVISQPIDQLICEDSTAIYEVEGDGMGYDYQWQIRTPGYSWSDLSDNSVIEGSLTDSLRIDGTYSLDDYELRCVLSNGLQTCSAFSDPATYGVYPIIEPYGVNWGWPNGVINPTVSFESYFGQMDMSLFDWYWDFGDGDTLHNDLNPEHTYEQNGDYEACLIIISECDSISECTQGITINTVGLSENKALSEVVIHPNPTNGKINIAWTNQNIETLSITNVLGQEIDLKNVDGLSDTSLNIRGEKGIYFIHLTDKNGNQTTRKLIKK